jgi:putative ABC transport system permease protein
MLRQAIRRHRRHARLTLVAAGSLALGIGAATAMFSVVDGILLQPLPYPDSERIVSVWETYPHWRGDPVLEPLWDRISLSWPDYERWRDAQRSFDLVAAWSWAPRTWMGPVGAERIIVGSSTPSLFPLLGEQATIGRLFSPGEQGFGASPVAVVSHPFWRDKLGGDPGAIGDALVVDGRSYTIVGVLPPSFFPPPARRDGSVAEMWIPVGADGSRLDGDDHSFRALGRLRLEADLASAEGEALPLLRGEAPADERGIRISALRDELVGDARQPLLLLLVAAGLLLILACGNVAALIVADAAGRAHEMVTRAALGARRRQLLGQLLAEGVLLGCVASAAGAAVAAVATRGLVALAPPELPLVELVSLNGRALALALMTGLGTGIVFGLTPAAGLIKLSRSTAGWSPAAAGGASRLQSLVTAGEVAFCTVMLVATMLLGRSLARLNAVDPGFSSSATLVLDVVLPATGYRGPAEIAAWHSAAKQSLEALPGASSAAAGTSVPFAGGDVFGAFEPEGRGELTAPAQARYNAVSAGFFEALAIPVLAGRSFAEADGLASDAAIVSEQLAARVWPDESPIGRRFDFQGRTRTIVGVVGDVHHVTRSESPEPEFYVPIAADAAGSGRYATLLVGVRGDSGALAQAARSALRSVDPSVPVTRVSTMDALLAASTAEHRYRTLLLSVFTGLTALLAALGISGVSARAVAERNREIGVRVALGAAPLDVLRLVSTRTLAGSILGATVGLAGAAFGRDTLSSLLYGIESGDLVSYASAAALSILLALAASALASHRALRIDPAITLKAD